MRSFLTQPSSPELRLLLVIVSIIGFVVLNLIPGGPLSQYGLEPGMTQDDIDRITEQLGLEPAAVGPVLRLGLASAAGRLGPSRIATAAGARRHRPHIFATLLLMGSSTLIAIAIGTWIGIRGATHRYSAVRLCGDGRRHGRLVDPDLLVRARRHLRLLARAGLAARGQHVHDRRRRRSSTTCTT